MESQTNAGRFRSRQDVFHKPVEPSPNLSFGNAYVRLWIADSPCNKIPVLQLCSVKGAEKRSVSPAGFIRISAPSIQVLIGVGDGKTSGHKGNALASERADRLAEISQLFGAPGLALEDPRNVRSAQFHPGDFHV